MARHEGRVSVDVGTGDGRLPLARARRDPSRLQIGVDACAAGLAATSSRAARKLARGGAPNALFLRAGVLELPGLLRGAAGEVTVILPWGSLLAGVARGDRAVMESLRGLCAPGAHLTAVFGYDEVRDAAEILRLGLPRLDEGHVGDLADRYGDAGLRVVAAGPLEPGALHGIPSTWAQRLGCPSRGYFRIDARAG